MFWNFAIKFAAYALFSECPVSPPRPMQLVVGCIPTWGGTDLRHAYPPARYSTIPDSAQAGLHLWQVYAYAQRRSKWTVCYGHFPCVTKESTTTPWCYIYIQTCSDLSLHGGVVEVAGVINYAEHFFALPEFSPSKLRNQAYRFFTLWQHGNLSKRNRRYAPSCVIIILAIKNKSPILLMSSTLSVRALMRTKKFRHCVTVTLLLQGDVASLNFRFTDDMSAWILFQNPRLLWWELLPMQEQSHSALEATLLYQFWEIYVGIYLSWLKMTNKIKE